MLKKYRKIVDYSVKRYEVVMESIMSELGNLLKSTREEQKKSIQDVVDDTRIRENFIKIIEEGRFKDLPSYLHAYGFVKKYAEFLNLDYENVVWPLFAAECPKEGAPAQPKDITQEEYTPSTTDTVFLENEKKNSKKPMTILLFIILLLLIGYGGYYMYSSSVLKNATSGSSSTVSNIPVPATVVEPEPAITFAGDNTSDNNSYFNYYGTSIYADNNTDNTTNNYDNITEPAYIDPLFAQTIPTPIVLSPEKVKISFSENCWFKYSTDKGEENEINAKRGTEIEIEFDKTFRVEIGNAVAVSMEYNGQKYSNFGNRNVVRILNYEAQDGKLELIRR